jgi:hypothetical protein
MKASPELREKMWELCYDLLPEGERSALIARIKSDPHAARLYAEVRLQADLVGYAATVEDVSLNLTVDAEKLKSAELAPAAGRRKEAAQPATTGAAKSRAQASGKSLWAANALAMAAGLALVLLIGVGLFRPGATAPVAQLYVTQVEVPGQLTSGVTSKVAVRTASPANLPVSAAVDVKLVDPDGLVRFHEMVATPPDGRADVELPGDAIRPGTRLQVEAREEEVREKLSLPEQQVAQEHEHARSDATRLLRANAVEIDLPVTQPEPVTYYVTDKPVADGDGQVRVTCLAFDPIRVVPQSPPLDDLEVKEEEITRRVRPEWRVKANLAEATISGVTAEKLDRFAAPAEQPPTASQAPEPQPAEPQPAEQHRIEQKLVEQKSFEKSQSAGRKLLQVERAKDAGLPLADRGAPADRREIQLQMAGGEGYAAAQGQYGFRAGRDSTLGGLGGAALGGAAPAGDSVLARGAPGASPAAARPMIASAPAAIDPAAPAAGAADAPALTDLTGKAKEADKSAIASQGAAKEADENPAAKKPGLAEQLFADQQDALAAAPEAPQRAMKQRQLVEAGQPVELELSPEQASKRLRATVESRGMQVAQPLVEPKFQRSVKNGQAMEERATVTLDVPAEVAGNVDVTFYDPVANTVVLKRELYRTPARGLRFEVLNLKNRYDPGELVQLQVKVVDEHGEAASAAGVARVWNEDFVADDRSQVVMLEDAVWKSKSPGEHRESEVLAQTGRSETAFAKGLARGGAAPQTQLAQSDIRAQLAELKKAEESPADAPSATAAPMPAARAPAPEPTPDASPLASAPTGPASGTEVARSNERAPEDSAADDRAADGVAAKLEGMLGAGELAGGTPTAGTQTYALAPDEYFVAQVPALTVSNEQAISQQVMALKSEQDRAAAAWRAMFGRVLIGSGLVALAILGLLFVMQQDIRWSSGTLALVASAASLVIGAAWITGGQPETMIAMAPGRNVEAAGAAIDAPQPMPAEPASASGMLAQNLQEIAPVPSAADFSAPPPAKEVAGDVERPGGEGKPAAAGLESLTPAKPAAPADPDAKNERAFTEKLAADDKQPVAKGATPSPAGSGAGGGRGGFGGGQGAGSKDPGGLGARPEDARPEVPRPEGAPSAAPALPPLGASEPAADRLGSASRAAVRAGGTAGPEAAAGTTPAPGAGAPRPESPAAAVPKATASAPRDVDQAEESEKLKSRESAAAPSAIYFNPQLATGEGGIVTIEFQLPEVASEYRVLLDAYGNGRVGSSADVKIVCKPAEAK